MRVSTLVLMTWLLVAGSAHLARAEEPAWFLVVGGDEAERQAAEPAARAWLAKRDVEGHPLRELEPGAESSFSPAALAALSHAEQALLEARSLTARFEEAEALRVLSSAEHALLASLDLPFAPSFLAELDVQIAIVAAALGQRGLSESSLRRAATLDPQRSLQAAEAAPDLVALARELARTRDGATPSRTRVETTPSGAAVFLDGAALGRAPCAVQAPPGSHVLVVREQGHATYAALITLEAGERAPLSLQLSPQPVEDARAALLFASSDSSRAQAAAPTLARALAGTVWLLELTSAPEGRAYACSEQCTLAGNIAWRGARRTPDGPMHAREAPFYKRWPFWLGVSAVVLSGAALTVWLARDEHTRTEREVTVNPGKPPSTSTP